MPTAAIIQPGLSAHARPDPAWGQCFRVGSVGGSDRSAWVLIPYEDLRLPFSGCLGREVRLRRLTPGFGAVTATVRVLLVLLGPRDEARWPCWRNDSVRSVRAFSTSRCDAATPILVSPLIWRRTSSQIRRAPSRMRGRAARIRPAPPAVTSKGAILRARRSRARAARRRAIRRQARPARIRFRAIFMCLLRVEVTVKLRMRHPFRGGRSSDVLAD